MLWNTLKNLTIYNKIINIISQKHIIINRSVTYYTVPVIQYGKYIEGAVTMVSIIYVWYFPGVHTRVRCLTGYDVSQDITVT